eukprot:CAMPEP_0202956658 /NCGR_PEP_ID=MMETSP1396-20130829/1160_1 /ASSEMBLY_ACC=CAM_ASM_000872 /TAXON_ID= /ORGANISM="Pseudokeronopsis sp., Strain Brazil" /LENGTH=54 /DNA_ID=CAMNT_0049673781 /DNA_START=565 /DNA_END=729 /DNA_ORIENTATION=-
MYPPPGGYYQPPGGYAPPGGYGQPGMMQPPQGWAGHGVAGGQVVVEGHGQVVGQ